MSLAPMTCELYREFVPGRTTYDPSWIRYTLRPLPGMAALAQLQRKLDELSVDDGQFRVLLNGDILFPSSLPNLPRRLATAQGHLLAAFGATGIVLTDNWPKQSWCLCRNRFNHHGAGQQHPAECDF